MSWRSPRRGEMPPRPRAGNARRRALEFLEPRCLLAVNASFAGVPGGIDPVVAAGIDRVVAAVDEKVGIFDKSGTLLDVSGICLTYGGNPGLFDDIDNDAVNWSNGFDPQVMYDPLADRFFVYATQTEIGAGSNEQSSFLAVSATGSPDDLDNAPGDLDVDWHVFRFDSTRIVNSILSKLDAPRFAIDDDSVFLVGDYYTFTTFTFQMGGIVRLDKAPLLNGIVGTRTDILGTGSSRLRPVQMYDASPGGPLMMVDENPSRAGIRVWELNDANQFTLAASLAAPYTVGPAGTPQPGTTALLRTQSPYLLHAMWRDESIWTAHTVGRPGTGEATVRWYEVSTGGGYSIIQSGDIVPGPGIHTSVPAIAVNELGDAALIYTTSSSSQFAAIEVAGRRPTDLLGTMRTPTLVKQGLGIYNPTSQPQVKKWGNYAGMSTDPTHPALFHAYHQHTTANPVALGSWMVQYTVNTVPVVTAGGPYVLDEGQPLLLSAAGTTDADPEDVLEYEWDINGDAVFGDVLGAEPIVDWSTLEALGIANGPSAWSVRVRVNDGRETIESLSTTLTVSNVAPTALSGGPYVIDEGQDLALAGSGSDPVDALTYSWDLNGDLVFGDATGPSPALLWNDLVTLGLDDGPSSWNVTLRVDDGEGGVTDSATTLDINNVAPTALSGGSYSIDEGQDLTLAGSGSDPVDAITYFWDLNGDLVFGDATGPSPALLWSDLVALGLTNGPTSWNVTLRVDDGDGGVTDSATTLDINNVAPTALSGGPYSIDEGQDLTLAGSGSDPVDAITYSWDLNGDLVFGDATGPSPALLWNDLVAFGVVNPGIYPITLRVDDGDVGVTDSVTTLEIVFVAAPQIVGVTIAGLTSTHPAYLMPVGSGEQLRTVPVGGMDRLAVQFSKDVGIAADDLTLTGTLGGTYTPSGFAYDSLSHTATWTLSAPILADQLTLTLPATILGPAAKALDGEWQNPLSVLDPSGSVFPSGDLQSGGDFVFRFNVLAGDANRDNIVTGADFTIWGDHFDGGMGPGNALFADGDFNGDGFVSGADFTHWADLFGTDFSSPPNAPAGGQWVDSDESLAPPTDDAVDIRASEVVFTRTSPLLRQTARKPLAKAAVPAESAHDAHDYVLAHDAWRAGFKLRNRRDS